METCNPICMYGTCVNQTCQCSPGYWGDACDLCTCLFFWKTVFCFVVFVFVFVVVFVFFCSQYLHCSWCLCCCSDTCPSDCGGHGRCERSSGHCMCDDGWTGLACEEFSQSLCLAHCEFKCSFFHHKGRVPIQSHTR